MTKEEDQPDERTQLLSLLEEARFIHTKLLFYLSCHPSMWDGAEYDEFMSRANAIAEELARHEQNLANAVPPSS